MLCEKPRVGSLGFCRGCVPGGRGCLVCGSLKCIVAVLAGGRFSEASVTLGETDCNSVGSQCKRKRPLGLVEPGVQVRSFVGENQNEHSFDCGSFSFQS